MSQKYYRKKLIAIPTVGKTVALSPDSGESLSIETAILSNSSGGAADIGFGWKHPNGLWKAGQYDNATFYADDTTDAQSAATDDVLLSDGNADGFVVQSIVPFNMVGFTIHTPGVGGSVASPTIQYFNGTAWTTITPQKVPDFTVTADSDTYLVFLLPADWAKGGPAGQGIDAGKYAILVTFATGPTTDPKASLIWVVTFLDFVEQLLDNGQLVMDTGGELVIPHGASIVPYFSVANAQNMFEVTYRPSR